MNATTREKSWMPFVKLFSEQNQGRPTRLGIFTAEQGAITDYWIESGLPLKGVSASVREEIARVEIMLGEAALSGGRHLTHTIENVRALKIVFDGSGNGGGLEIEDGKGDTTLLRFED